MEPTPKARLCYDEINNSINALENSIATNYALIEHIESLRNEKAKLIEEKGRRLAERLGSKWYNEGEKSTKYFLRLLNRSMPDKIAELKVNNDTITSDSEIEKEIVKFYKNLYENDKLDTDTHDDLTFFDEITAIPAENSAFVAAPITTAELWDVLKECKDTAPGPDGIPFSFLKSLWSTFGDLLCESWVYSQTTNTLPD